MLCRVITAALCLTTLADAQQPNTKAAIASLTRDVPRLMQQADIPGISIALIENGRTAWLRSFGTVDPATNAPVTDHTSFSAASLSKPVFAYAVLKLVDKGKLDLDTPLTHYWPGDGPYPIDPANDPRLSQITARIVLSHRTGFPNWRPDGKPLTIYFTPGSRFSYSGEGYVYLQRTIERIEGKPLNQIMQELVFTPLGMNDSTYISQPGPGITSGYSPALKPRGPIESKDGNAAASLLTNAHDYALFVEAILSGRGLKPATLRQMETPQIAVDPTCTNCANRPATTTLSKDIFWDSAGVSSRPRPVSISGTGATAQTTRRSSPSTSITATLSSSSLIARTAYLSHATSSPTLSVASIPSSTGTTTHPTTRPSSASPTTSCTMAPRPSPLTLLTFNSTLSPRTLSKRPDTSSSTIRRRTTTPSPSSPATSSSTQRTATLAPASARVTWSPETNLSRSKTTS
jgi:CubicO group peptidase (beta-lactamase class C family)